jgi:hypothetical protein
MVEALAKEMKCSKHQAVVNAIALAHEKVTVHEKALGRAREILTTRDKALMERLADA